MGPLRLTSQRLSTMSHMLCGRHASAFVSLHGAATCRSEFTSRGRRWNPGHGQALRSGNARSFGIPPRRLFRSASAASQEQAPSASSKAPVASAPLDGELAALLSLKRYVWPSDSAEARRSVVAALGLMVTSKVLNLQVPLVLRSVVDSVTPALGEVGAAEIVAMPMAAILCYGAVRMGTSLFSELRNVAFSSVSARANTTISKHVFDHLHQLSLQYHLSRQTGALATTMDRGKRGMQWILSVVVFNVVPTILEVVLVSCWLGYALGPSLGFITAGTIGVYSVYTCVITSWRTKIRKQMNEADSAAGSLVVDSLMNYETVKIFNAERHESRRYSSQLSDYEIGLRQTATSLALLNFGQQVIFASGMTAMLLLCAEGVTMGTMTVGDLVMANAFLLQLSQPLNWLGTMYSETRRSLIDFQAMNAMLEDKQTQPLPRPGALPLFVAGASVGPLSVTFDSVAFRYPTAFAETPPLLRGVSFHVPAGETLGIVGHSGSGKSSVLRLLLRFYDCEAGAISVDGRDIRDIQLGSLRRGIGLVPQDIVLFNTSLYENVRYGDPEASDEEVQRAIRGAALESVAAALPNGLQTIVGERGLKLSGGEKQRVAIARVLLKRPQILLVDEGTASLDSKTESDILTELRAASAERSCTTIMIAHRLSTLRAAEQICVVRDGLVSEVGSHESLLKLGKEYADLWARQQSEPQADQR